MALRNTRSCFPLICFSVAKRSSFNSLSLLSFSILTSLSLFSTLWNLCAAFFEAAIWPIEKPFVNSFDDLILDESWDCLTGEVDGEEFVFHFPGLIPKRLKSSSYIIASTAFVFLAKVIVFKDSAIRVEYILGDINFNSKISKASLFLPVFVG